MFNILNLKLGGDINDGFLTVHPQKLVIPIISTIEKKNGKKMLATPLYRGSEVRDFTEKGGKLTNIGLLSTFIF